MNPNPEDTMAVLEEMRRVCRDAWRQGLLSGCNGNVSCRLPAPHDGRLCVTRSGAAKGRLTPEDCCLVDVRSGETLSGGPASSELGMHLALYRALPHCRAVLHSHPRHLLALSLVLRNPGDFLRLPLFEAGVWRARLGFASALPPGSGILALAVADAALKIGAEKPGGAAVWMTGHGLCCWGPTLADALSISEELEHLAAVQLLAR
ncbi:class II aldolase/adducin family protein [Desulfovibrio sp. PG-178-WT-4]|uniref:Class II aldolase/adducin family protein n=2 Tax=Desulfovibrio TaxID=872 RepID=A0A6L5XIA4_9BACT|nr:class II aldolase/adducin family protein [Desulfovibrio porci]MDY3809688.1 class II aldolase/adducin family protein [Desulfovibrio porci]MSS26950.1 class II aldolase/adducin family protein [Desulfovibrio porci]